MNIFNANIGLFKLWLYPKTESCLKLVTMMYLYKFEENPSTGSKDIVGTRICHLNPPLTLKMRLWSPKSNQLLSLSQSYIFASLKKIHSLVQKIFHLQDYDLENEVKVNKILSALEFVTIIYLCKFDENQSTGSKDISLTRL